MILPFCLVLFLLWGVGGCVGLNGVGIVRKSRLIYTHSPLNESVSSVHYTTIRWVTNINVKVWKSNFLLSISIFPLVLSLGIGIHVILMLQMSWLTWLRSVLRVAIGKLSNWCFTHSTFHWCTHCYDVCCFSCCCILVPNGTLRVILTYLFLVDWLRLEGMHFTKIQ